MKVLFLALLLLLCSTQVFTLRCYTCEGENDDICKNVSECPSSAQYCKTTDIDNKLSRTCEDFCAEDLFTTCCQGDLC
ncbi:lymphocyte antigen 6D [Thunnus albacares]|uniref:lymphocyte antigen 6D n=1 Tax=Thunnus maccoyii TaxID=8240 RepID=UPI001C4A7FA5|nr:lymphocyte antigen 6D [Thunnus maccoyii]XP_044210831.1 lymphocyte antigen 6D [Thunnus albacares]